MNLQEENKKLKQQLQAAQEWMSREVASAEKDIALHKTQSDTSSLYHENLEDIIEDKIYSFFPAEVLSHFPENGVENIISSELIYYHIVSGGHVDGTGVMIGYQKVIDSMVELYITKGYRKYIKKHATIFPPKNIPLEKAFYSVIEKKYILSLGRLYESLKKIKKGDSLPPYLQHFKSYLKSRDFLYKALLESDFLLQLELLMNLHAVGEKRHNGSLNQDDTTKARNACNGNFEDKNCILYLLASSQASDI